MYLMDKYRVYGKIGEGSFSEVFKASPILEKKRNDFSQHEQQQQQNVAIKCLRNDRQTISNLQNHHQHHSTQTVLECHEVQVLQLLQPHPNIIKLLDVFVDPRTLRLCIVTELMTMNLFEFSQLFKKEPIAESVVRSLVYQTLSALCHVHDHGLFHRDIKPENLLIRDGILKLGDFGSCKAINSSLLLPHTEYIATRWYRAPECLQTNGMYSFKMDLWSVGCVMYELLSGRPLFPGENEMQQLCYIQKLVRKVTDPTITHDKLIAVFKTLLPQCSSDGLSLLIALLMYSPEERVSAHQALQHVYFISLRQPLSLLQLNNTTAPVRSFRLESIRSCLLSSRSSSNSKTSVLSDDCPDSQGCEALQKQKQTEDVDWDISIITPQEVVPPALITVDQNNLEQTAGYEFLQSPLKHATKRSRRVKKEDYEGIARRQGGSTSSLMPSYTLPSYYETTQANTTQSLSVSNKAHNRNSDGNNDKKGQNLHNRTMSSESMQSNKYIPLIENNLLTLNSKIEQANSSLKSSRSSMYQLVLPSTSPNGIQMGLPRPQPFDLMHLAAVFSNKEKHKSDDNNDAILKELNNTIENSPPQKTTLDIKTFINQADNNQMQIISNQNVKPPQDIQQQLRGSTVSQRSESSTFIWNSKNKLSLLTNPRNHKNYSSSSSSNSKSLLVVQRGLRNFKLFSCLPRGFCQQR